ncbi:ABC transporter permease [Demequina litorisediminis]|uniref:Molybdenum transport system permease n=1 Tax=Demequina litorisediminis TaxID=1849022 RepID=A0ABQ6I8V4_9MICO|nr:ABC transporter permease [Demequina litorisediminis]GMA34268.1 molybdate ABC transporter permease [Demequina litorisediminis]
MTAAVSTIARPRTRAGATVTPRWLAIPAVAGAALIVLPLLGLVSRVDWSQLPTLVTSEASLAAVALSARTVAASTALVVLLGVPMAVLLARVDFRGKTLVRTLVLAPLVLPPVVGGLGLLYAFGKRGLLGESLAALGIDIAFSTTAVVLAQTFVALPFLVLSLEGALRADGTRYEDAAATLGAGPWTTLRRVTLRRVWPALVAGTVIAAARALGEFGATLTFAGSLEGVTRTIPLEIYLQREMDPDAAVALSLVLVVVALLVVALAYGGAARAARASARPTPEVR